MNSLWMELFGNPPLLIYMAVGAVVAFIHARRQNMDTSMKRDNMYSHVLWILAAIWPVLLFAMLVEYLSPPKYRGKKRAQDE